MQRITIIGLGRVGASIGLALKQWIGLSEASAARKGGIEVVGFDFDVDRQKAAEKLRAVDRTQWSLTRAVQDAALVVLAVPAREEQAVIREVAPLLPADSILTDTAPYKQQSLQWATRYLPEHVSFVAGHPVLPTASDTPPSADLLAGCTYGLFPHPRADQYSTEVVVGLVQIAGAKPYFADPAEHDAQVAATTMLPALAATAMMHTVTTGGGWRDLSAMATSDLAELTRFASEEPADLFEMVTLAPSDADRWLSGYIARLGELRDLVRRDDPEASERLQQFFKDAHAAREKWVRGSEEQGPQGMERRGVSDHVNRLFLGRRSGPDS